MKNLIGVTTIALVASTLSLAGADVTPKVQKAFRGRILITPNGLPDARSTDDETIALFKKSNASKLEGTKNDDGVSQWSFQFTAFLKTAPKVTSLSFDFYTDDKEKLYVANKGMMGVDPAMDIISGSLSINEDDGLVRGKRYIIKLTGKVKKKEVVFAETKVKFE
jgi:hypothetical protein